MTSADPKAIIEDEPDETLTRREWHGLASEHNLADGHARQALSNAQSGVVDGLAGLFRESEAEQQLVLQRAFEESFYGRANQHSVLHRDRQPMHHYSSSVSTEVVANFLRAEGMRVALLHPTFDNIAAILRRHGVTLRPVSEAIFEEPDDDAFYEDCDAVFLVLPNNPTGRDPEPEVIQAIARQCRDRRLFLILDVCFRFFSRHLATWDQYEHFDALGLRYIGIEDTGKTWPTLDLKVGSLIVDEASQAKLQRITDDVLLNVSPLVFRLLRDFVVADDGLDCLGVSRRNRASLSRALEGSPLRIVPSEAPMCVAWLEMPPGWTSAEVCDWLERRSVSLLPGEPFFWADAELGARFLRVALLRPEDAFARGAAALAEAIADYAPAGADLAEEMTPEPAASAEAADALVRRIASEVLGVTSVGSTDDFFAVGGDSLMAMHLIGRLREETGLPLRVSTLFEHPAFDQLAARIEQVAVEAEEDLSGNVATTLRDVVEAEDRRPRFSR